MDVEALKLDDSKLHAATIADRGEIYLLNYLSQVEKSLGTLPEETIRTCQAQLQSTLLKILLTPPSSSSPSPKPGRPIRSLVARCLILILSRGESRPLFDIVQRLLRTWADLRTEREYKIAALACTGQIMKALGSQILSVATDIVTQCLRIIKTSGNPVILRCAALECLRDTLQSSGKAINDPLAKDLAKTFRGLLMDKLYPLQRGAAECISVYYEAGVASLTVSDLETIISQVIKALDATDFETRNTLARLVGGLLAYSQLEGSAPAAEPKKKPVKTVDGKKDEEDDPYPTGPSAQAEQAKSLYTLQEMLLILSTPLNKLNSSRKTVVGIINIYAALFTALGSTFIENNYVDLLKHLIQDVGNGPRANINHFERLTMRKCIGLLLREVIGVRLLSEEGQIIALREVAQTYLSKYPALLPGQITPNKNVLLLAAEETAGLLQQLGSAPSLVQEALYEPLLRLIEHPNHTIQIAASVALKQFCYVAPAKLLSTISIVVEMLTKDLGQLATQPDVKSRALGRTHALMALISLIPLKPLYVSYDVSARIMSLAIQLLKESGNHDLPLSIVEIQIAWMLVSALMCLGPSFAKVHLSQLLILWKNALPKPSSKDTSASQIRSETEWSFLLTVRGWTLTAILSFLKHSTALISADIGRRVAVLLSNALAFSNTFFAQYRHISPESSAHFLVEKDLQFRRSLFRCFVALNDSHIPEAQQGALLASAIQILVDPDVNSGSNLQAAIASQGGLFVSIWECGDGLAYGVNSLLGENGVEDQNAKSRPWLNRDTLEASISEMASKSVLRAFEHDSFSLCLDREIAPTATSLVDEAMYVFSTYFAQQSLRIQTSLLADMSGAIGSAKIERNPGRKMAAVANTTVGLLLCLRRTMGESGKKATENFALAQLNKPIGELLKDACLHSDSRLRLAGSEALGRLCAVAGVQFMSHQIQTLVNQVVSNTDPSSRAGCAVSLGSIYANVGSLSAGPVLKTIVDILGSLANDPHPLVHFWAIYSLSQVIDAASLTFSPFTHSTLGMVVRLFLSEAHEPESGNTPASINGRGDLPAYYAMCTTLDAIIGVLGPELADDDRMQLLILALLQEFRQDNAREGVQVQAIKALQHFLMFCPNIIDLPVLVSSLRLLLSSQRRPLKTAAINSVYQLVQRHAPLMSKLGGNSLVEELFALLDDDPSIDGVRDSIISWLKQTVEGNPSGWIDLCQRIMLRTTATKVAIEASQTPVPDTMGFTDEESQGLGQGGADGVKRARNTSRWRTQLFALECVHRVFDTLLESGRHEHFSASSTRQDSQSQKFLIYRISDLIKMAFTASTSPAVDIRLAGLVVLRDVIRSYSATRDLDFGNAYVLEQYQASITAALAPAFAFDSFPEVLASAIQVCAVVVSSGSIKDLGKSSRIVRLLTTALDNCKDTDMISMGDVTNLSSTAAVLLKISVFSAWAEMQGASGRHAPLKSLLEPYLADLCTFWLATLREYARLRVPDTESMNGNSMTSNTVSLDSFGSTLTREVALPYYEAAWQPMLRAIAGLLKLLDARAISAIKGFSNTTDGSSAEPMYFFYVVYGLAFEVLATSNSSPTSTRPTIIALQAIEGILSRDISGISIIGNGLFEELIALLLRMITTEKSAQVRLAILSIVSTLAKNFPSELIKSSVVKEKASVASSQIIGCLSLIMAVLKDQVACVASGTAPTILETACLTWLVIADICPTGLKEDLYAVLLSIISQLLALEVKASDATGHVLGALKLVVDQAALIKQTDASSILGRALQGLLSSCLQNVEEVRSTEGESAVWKAKNNLLASVLIMTSLPLHLKISQALVDHLCTSIIALLQGAQSELRLAALHCVHSLLASSTRDLGPLQYCAYQLLPSVIMLILAEGVESKLQEEFLQVLSRLVAAVEQSQRKPSLDIVLPVYLAYLNKEGTSREAAVKLIVDVATLDSPAFKSATNGLDIDQKNALEYALRSSMEQRAMRSNSNMPAINLKAFG